MLKNECKIMEDLENESKAAEDAGMRREDFAIEVAKISSY